MPIASRIIQYKRRNTPINEFSFYWSRATYKLAFALSDLVTKIVFNDSGKATTKLLFAKLAETYFEDGREK